MTVTKRRLRNCAERIIQNKHLEIPLLAIIGLTLYLIITRFWFPGIFVNGRIWAEEGRDFLSNALSVGPVRAVAYIHKRHIDLIPNIASSIAASAPPMLWPRIYPITAVLPYGFMFSCLSIAMSSTGIDREHAGPKTGQFLPKQNQIFSINAIGIGVYTFLIATSPVAWEPTLNTINSWSILVAGFAIVLPYLSGPKAYWLPLWLTTCSFPCCLFTPYLASRCWKRKDSNAILMFQGAMTGTGIQLAFITLIPRHWSLPLMSERSFSLCDGLAIPSLVATKLLPMLIGDFNGIGPGEPCRVHSISMHHWLPWTFLLMLSVPILYSRSRSFVTKKAVALMKDARKIPNKSKHILISSSLADTFAAIGCWQLLALILALGGSNNLLYFGSTNRYFYSFYCVWVFLLVSVTTRGYLSSRTWKMKAPTAMNIRPAAQQVTAILAGILLINLLRVPFQRPYSLGVMSHHWCFQTQASPREIDSFEKVLICPKE